MSASLVGSEMCIRDSLCLGEGAEIRHLVPIMWSLWQQFTQAAPYDQQRPVSYTHLTLPTICSV
eukprot:12644193-Alexandrium_andersonii.AAC.1